MDEITKDKMSDIFCGLIVKDCKRPSITHERFFESLCVVVSSINSHLIGNLQRYADERNWTLMWEYNSSTSTLKIAFV